MYMIFFLRLFNLSNIKIKVNEKQLNVVTSDTIILVCFLKDRQNGQFSGYITNIIPTQDYLKLMLHIHMTFINIKFPVLLHRRVIIKTLMRGK